MTPLEQKTNRGKGKSKSKSKRPLTLRRDSFKGLKFDSQGLIPAIVQDDESGRVLMVAYMNRAALSKTLRSGQSWFFSRSRKKLWKKGETSGHTQKIREIWVDCDQDTLLLKVEQKGAACHTGMPSCFFEEIFSSTMQKGSHGRKKIFSLKDKLILEQVEAVIGDRKRNPKKGSYVSQLFHGGQDRILKKITEEAGELVIGSKNKKHQEIIDEMADLWFHCLIVLGFHGIPLSKLYAELEGRYGRRREKEK